MPPFSRAAVLLAAIPALALAQPAAPPPPGTRLEQAAPPPEGPPAEAPPPPPLEPDGSLPPAPPQAPVPTPPAATQGGEWVYTSQYGWLWMSYDPQYVSIPDDPTVFPEAYVYYPVYGWRWIVAPWVYGYGPEPRWGPAGVTVFVWYAHPWFRVGGYWGWGGYRGWGHYRGWMGPRRWGPRGWVGAPAYYRTGVGPRRPAASPARGEREHERPRGEHRGHER